MKKGYRKYIKQHSVEARRKAIVKARVDLLKFARLVQKIIHMHDVDHMSFPEIADELKISSRHRAFTIYKSNKPDESLIDELVKNPPF